MENITCCCVQEILFQDTFRITGPRITSDGKPWGVPNAPADPNCMETGETTKSLQYGRGGVTENKKCLETGKTITSLVS